MVSATGFSMPSTTVARSRGTKAFIARELRIALPSHAILLQHTLAKKDFHSRQAVRIHSRQAQLDCAGEGRMHINVGACISLEVPQLRHKDRAQILPIQPAGGIRYANYIIEVPRTRQHAAQNRGKHPIGQKTNMVPQSHGASTDNILPQHNTLIFIEW